MYSVFLVAVGLVVFIEPGVEASATPVSDVPPPQIEQAFTGLSLPTTPEPSLHLQVNTDDIVYDYPDVSDSHFAALDIAALAADGILAGTDCQPGQFCPDVPIERWVLAVWMVRVLDGGDPVVKRTRFEDVVGRPWWESYVERLAELGVTVGCSAEPLRFCPYDTVTRAQMAAFLDRAFDLPDAPDAGFIDTLGVFSKTSIDRLYQEGITRGCSDVPLRFCPGARLTRAEMAAFLQRGRPSPQDDVALAVDYGPDVEFYVDPLPGVEDIVVTVHYCGPPNVFTRADLAVEVARVEQVATFFWRESDGQSTVRFETGDLFIPSEARRPRVWANESITKWSGSKEDNPCYNTVFGGPNDGASSSSRRQISLILANVEAGENAQGSSVTGYGPPGGALFGGIEPHVVVQPAKRDNSSTRFWLVAHEIGHAGYSLCHAFSAGQNCARQGVDSAVKSNCERRGAGPDCDGDTRLEELAGSLMSYTRWGSYTKLSDSYIACEQRKWLGWYDGTCGAPAAPRVFDLEEENGRITVRWNPPGNSGWSPITGYYIRLTRTGANQGLTHGPFSGNSRTFTGLTNGVSYKVEVRAANTQGKGDWSNPRYAEPGAQVMIPDAPRVGASVSGSTVSASWSASDNGSPIDGWEIGGTGEVGAGTTTYVWHNVEPGSYRVRVRARNAAGWSDWGVSNSVTVDQPAVHVPDAPRVSAVVSGSTVSASWSASDNGSPIDGWEIGGTGEVGAGTTTYVWRNVEPGSYRVRVRARNAAGWSDWGESNRVTVAAQVTVAPVAYDAGSAVRNRWNWSDQGHAGCLAAVFCRNVGVSNLSDFGSGPYQLECWVAGQSSAGWSGSWNGSSNAGCYYWGAQPFTVYVKINGVESNRVVLRPPTLQRPGVPRVRAVVSGNTISASWSASDNGSPIDGWELRGTGEVGASTTSYVWDGQQPGTYSVWVRAHNAAGWGEWGESNDVTVAAQVTVAPVAYDAGSAVRNRWNWSDQGHAGCLAAVFCRNVGVSNLSDFGSGPYQLECWVAGQSSAGWSGSWNGSSNAGCYYWGAQPFTVYVKINGVESNRVVLRPPTLQRPGVPRVRAVVSGNTISASWSASDNGSPIDGWELRGTGEVGASTTSYVWDGQQPGTYSVWVRAHNAAGWGEWGESNDVTVAAQVTVAPVAYDAGSAVRNRWNWSDQGHAGCLAAVFCRNVGVSNLSDFGSGPYQLECWVAGQSSAGWSGSWNGSSNAGCYYWGAQPFTVYVKINGQRSNDVTVR